MGIEFTIFFSLSKQQLNLVIIIKEYKQWEVPLWSPWVFFNEIDDDDVDDDDDGDDDDNVDDEDNDPNFFSSWRR